MAQSMSTTIRARRDTRDRLRAMAEADGINVPDLLDRLTTAELERREVAGWFAAVDALPDDELAAYRAEQRELEGTLADGLQEQPWES